MTEYHPIAFFLFLGLLVGVVAIVVSRLVSYSTPDNAYKKKAYECGSELFGDARIQFKVGYYLFALLFLIFDIESLFLFPAVRIFSSVAAGEVPGMSAWLLMLELGVFVLVLVTGLVYAWRKGALRWD